MILTLDQARDVIRRNLETAACVPSPENLPLEQALGRVLAANACADRDYPPFPRSARDGYAVRSSDCAAAPVTLRCQGEVRAGGFFAAALHPQECVRIMTGAPVPAGADSVVMVEQTEAKGEDVTFLRSAAALDNIVPQGAEARKGAVVLTRGRRIDPGAMGLLASIGAAEVKVFKKPEVAILPTGDELVSAEIPPEWFQIRNSNSYSLSAQVSLAGGKPRPLAIAPDEAGALRTLLLDGLKSDLLLVSGGVSAGKYDLVESILSDLGAEFFFDGVSIRPGKPAVFGRVRDKFFFGLPGNPISTYVTFELLARPAISALTGAGFEPQYAYGARLTGPVKPREDLTVFIPAHAAQSEGSPVVAPVAWQGSGDMAGFAAANCFIVLRPGHEIRNAGDWVEIMPKRF
ncbi:MAG: molybdopterin molybdotransferase MoeA [Acidobacteriota bacterium]|nr:molybdopterin molybdotransferase MoeA [Acidobacteriota bacterium]